ncbi:MAG TPA: stage V sporulation protein E, partial [Nitrospirota bacterium]
MFRRIREDRIILIITLALVAFGLVMVFSASSVMAMKKFDDAAYFFKRQ